MSISILSRPYLALGPISGPSPRRCLEQPRRSTGACVWAAPPRGWPRATRRSSGSPASTASSPRWSGSTRRRSRSRPSPRRRRAAGRSRCRSGSTPGASGGGDPGGADEQVRRSDSRAGLKVRTRRRAAPYADAKVARSTRRRSATRRSVRGMVAVEAGSTHGRRQRVCQLRGVGDGGVQGHGARAEVRRQLHGDLRARWRRGRNGTCNGGATAIAEAGAQWISARASAWAPATGRAS